MAVRTRFDIKRQIHAILPGLLHFASSAWRVEPVSSNVKWIRLYLPENECLNLNGIEIIGPREADFAGATTYLSSTHPSSAPAADLLKRRPIHTEREPHPSWNLIFPSPVNIKSIEVFNRAGVWSNRSYGLCVSVGLQNGSVITFDNAMHATILMRLGHFRARAEGLVASLNAAGIPTPLRQIAAQILSSTNEIVRDVTDTFSGSVLSLNELSNRRLSLLSCIENLNKQCPDDQLQITMPWIASLCDYLLDRSYRPQNWEATPQELEAVSTIFTAQFAKHHSVKSIFVQENQCFLGNRKDVLHVEDRVNELYARTTGDTAILPIMFRAHGMSGAELNANAPKYIASMAEIAAILEGIGYPTAICYGTLLGAVRTGTFIPHDDDVDMAMIVKSSRDDELEQELNEIIRKLEKLDVKAKITDGFKFLKVWAPKAGKFSDIFPIILKDENTVRMYMERLKIRDVPKACVLPFSEMIFFGESFKTPAVPSTFLADRYGEDWNVPQRMVAATLMRA